MPVTVAEILQEFDQEWTTTRRVLERVPADQLTWKPHEKSISLGQLALHVAMGPGLICEWTLQDSLESPSAGALQARYHASPLCSMDPPGRSDLPRSTRRTIKRKRSH